ncbi:glycosyltransferase [Sphingosinicella rhizophila]|uniref:Glycosyltransferase n=1 Tax=Sphingosinicella rhizophila TaxID=3050082 RepID=A0ABU3QDI2_9SPHN|nr:glycosyltransferase [Sphingosinicella sp. GR2756]MDT9601030.1 glycosyltransferase [Sphingosinicella sp. GR2756]
MLRVLTLATLFPSTAQPTLGGFVERQTIGLAARDDVELQVVSPVGLPPWPLSLHPHYRARGRLPLREIRKDLIIHRPRFLSLPARGAAMAPRAMARALLPLLREIRKDFPFDIIDAEFFWPDGPTAMHLAAALAIPFSIKARGADIHYWPTRAGIGGQILAAGKAADGLLAVSEALKADMMRLGMPGTIAVHYTGVDPDLFKPIDRAEAKAALGVQGPLIVTAGALIPRKGQSLALSALAEIPDATLLFVGDGPDRRLLEERAKRSGVDRRVRFLGNRPHETLPGLFGAADIMLLPSRSEGLANVWVESLACGTPIVIPDIGGAREVVDRPEAGRLTPADPAAMAIAVREILADPPAQEAVRRSAERFSWERNSEALFEHLSGLAHQRSSPETLSVQTFE